MINKEECKRVYRELKDNISDLESSTFRALWFSRLEHLKELGCWWHYAVLKKQATHYNSLKNQSGLNAQLSSAEHPLSWWLE